MNKQARRFFQNESGITALETAIILIAFVVVALVFAFTILSTGTFTTERGKEAIYAGLAQVRGTMELKGGVIAQGLPSTVVSQVQFTVATVAGGDAVDLSLGSDQKIVIDYRDASQVQTNVAISVSSIVGDGDTLLEEGELARVLVPLNGQTILGATGTVVDSNLIANQEFSLEVKPPNGPVILIQRSMPAYIDTVMDLR